MSDMKNICLVPTLHTRAYSGGSVGRYPLGTISYYLLSHIICGGRSPVGDGV